MILNIGGSHRLHEPQIARITRITIDDLMIYNLQLLQPQITRITQIIKDLQFDDLQLLEPQIAPKKIDSVPGYHPERSRAERRI